MLSQKILCYTIIHTTCIKYTCTKGCRVGSYLARVELYDHLLCPYKNLDVAIMHLG